MTHGRVPSRTRKLVKWIGERCKWERVEASPWTCRGFALCLEASTTRLNITCFQAFPMFTIHRSRPSSNKPVKNSEFHTTNMELGWAQSIQWYEITGNVARPSRSKDCAGLWLTVAEGRLADVWPRASIEATEPSRRPWREKLHFAAVQRNRKKMNKVWHLKWLEEAPRD